MMHTHAKIFGFVLCALAVAACGEDGGTAGNAGTGGSGGVGGMAGTGGSAGTQTSTVTGVVLTADDAETRVDGATVAVFGTQISATTNASGEFTLSSVPNGEVFFVTEADGHWGVVDYYHVPGETGAAIALRVVPDSEIALLSGALSRTIDPSQGAVNITYEDAAGGETGTISVAADPPFTFDLAGLPVVQDTVIADEDGYADLVFTGVDTSGRITAAVTGAAGVTTCQIDQSSGTTYPIVAKSITVVYAWCVPAL